MPNYTDYKFRAHTLKLDESTGILYHCNLAKRVNYCQTFDLPLPEDYNPTYFAYTTLNYQIFYPDEWAECEKIINADRERCRRLRHRLEYLITNYDAHFITFDFADDYLARSSVSTRRQGISRFLNSLDTPYIANIDYGETNGREHYHAVVGCRVPKQFYWDYVARGIGSLYIVKVRKNKRSEYSLSKYITKLCNHAVKYTCRRSALLYSRNHKLPSTKKEVAKLGIMPLPVYQTTPPKTTTRVIRFTPPKNVFTARCAQCHGIIADMVYNEHKYTITRPNSKGKIITQHFCKECIEKYNIKISEDK